MEQGCQGDAPELLARLYLVRAWSVDDLSTYPGRSEEIVDVKKLEDVEENLCGQLLQTLGAVGRTRRGRAGSLIHPVHLGIRRDRGQSGISGHTTGPLVTAGRTGGMNTSVTITRSRGWRRRAGRL